MKRRSISSSSAVVEVSGAAVEGFLNRCRQRGIELLRVEKTGKFSLRAELSAADVRIAKSAAMASQCELRLLRDGIGVRAGRKLHRRAAAAMFGLLFVVLLFWGKFFIWEIQVSGNNTVPTGKILSALDDCGVESGAFWPGISSEGVRSRVLAEIPQLAWISVNMRGCLAQVRVVERILPPEMIYKGTPMNIVAKKDGFVMSVSAPVGTALISRGSAVLAGDILISGVVESSFAQPRFLRAQGSVIAETFTHLQTVSPEEITAKSPNGRQRSRFALIIGDNRINFYSDSSISGMKCDTIISVWKAEVKGLFSLPVSIVRETDIFYETQEAPADGTVCRLLMDALLDELLAQSLGGGELLDSDRESFCSDGLIRRVLRARCLEDIGLARPIDQQQMDEANYNFQQKANETNGGTQN